MNILIISGLKDAHAGVVDEILTKLSFRVHRFSYKDFSEGLARVTLQPGNAGIGYITFDEREAIVSMGGEPFPVTLPGYELPLENIDLLFFHKTAPIFIDESIGDYGQLAYMRREASETLDSFWELLRDKEWINRPSSVHHFTKPVQLQLAKAVGMKIPETIITTDESHLLKFIENHVRLAYKSVSDGIIYDFDNSGNIIDFKKRIYTEILDQRFVIENTDAITSTPAIVQQAVEKISDMRVVVIGKEVFGFEIKGGDINLSDWKLNDQADIHYSRHDLPVNVSDQCIQLIKDLKLDYGAIDFALTIDGYIFFEVNPSGAWLWLEEACQVPMSETLVALIQAKIRSRGSDA